MNSDINFMTVGFLPCNKYQVENISKAISFIEANLSTNLSLEDIARHCHVSVFHFSRVFKRVTNYSPHQYLQYVRLHHAQGLLKESNLSITQVAHQTGYSSVEYFATAFKSEYQMNPTQYRRSALVATV